MTTAISRTRKKLKKICSMPYLFLEFITKFCTWKYIFIVINLSKVFFEVFLIVFDWEQAPNQKMFPTGCSTLIWHTKNTFYSSKFIRVTPPSSNHATKIIHTTLYKQSNTIFTNKTPTSQFTTNFRIHNRIIHFSRQRHKILHISINYKQLVSPTCILIKTLFLSDIFAKFERACFFLILLPNSQE